MDALLHSQYLQIEARPLEALSPYARNPKQHGEEQLAKLVSSLREFGWTFPILTDEHGEVIAGHGRLMAAQRILKHGWTIPGWPDTSTAPVLAKEGLTESQKRAYRILDNRVAEESGWDNELLSLELDGLAEAEFDLALTGFDANEIGQISKALTTETPEQQREEANKSLADRFMVVPFSVLDARRGWWMDRKESWLKLGLRSEAGRDALLTFSQSSQPPAVYEAKNRYEAKIGRPVSWDEFFAANPDPRAATDACGDVEMDEALFAESID